MDLLERDAADEWIGQDSGSAFWGSRLYTGHLSGILATPLESIQRICRLLVAEERIAMEGQVPRRILSRSGDGPNVPSRLWATYSEKISTVRVFLPASGSEPREARIEVDRFGARHDHCRFAFSQPVGPDGEPHPEDLELLRRWLATHMGDWRKPMLGPFALDLDPVEEGNPYDPTGLDPGWPSDPWNTASTADGHHEITVFLPASNTERSEAAVVAHPHGPPPHPATVPDEHRRIVPLNYPTTFGLDQQDLADIEAARANLQGAITEAPPDSDTDPTTSP